MVYKFGTKKFKNWDEMDEYTRSKEFEKEWENAKKVKFSFGCVKCKKTIKGKVRGGWEKGKKGSEFSMYCKKCFRENFHPVIKYESRNCREQAISASRNSRKICGYPVKR